MASRSAERAHDLNEDPKEARTLITRLRIAAVGHGGERSFDGWAGFGWQILFLTPPALLYFLVRDIVADQRAEAFANAASIVDLQKTLGLDWEATLQQRVLDTAWIIDAVNWIYIYGHFPVIVASMVLLFRLSRRNYLTLRNALIVSGAIGLVCFTLYPVAPPRLFAPDAFFDSLGELSASYRILQNPKLTNQFAAVPSFHVGWNLLVAIALWRASRFRPLRAVALLLPVLMTISVVLTANHWLLDIAAGVAVALAGIGAAGLFERVVAPRIIVDLPTAVASTDTLRSSERRSDDHSEAEERLLVGPVGLEPTTERL